MGTDNPQIQGPTARFTVLPSVGAASVYELTPGITYTVGRDQVADIVLSDYSVSRPHARIFMDADPISGESVWWIKDKSSLNGIYLNGLRIQQGVIESDSWLRLGNVYCHFELSAAVDDHTTERSILSRPERRRRTNLSRHQDIDSLSSEVLNEVVRMLEPDRAYLLLNSGQGEWIVQHAVGSQAEPLNVTAFGGNALALQRCAQSGKPVIIHDNWPSSVPSVELGTSDPGLSAILVFPLMAKEQIIGLIYADSRKPGATVTELDRDLVEGVAAQAALPMWLARMRMELNVLKSDYQAQGMPEN